jgi:hypothetical protein
MVVRWVALVDHLKDPLRLEGEEGRLQPVATTRAPAPSQVDRHPCWVNRSGRCIRRLLRCWTGQARYYELFAATTPVLRCEPLNENPDRWAYIWIGNQVKIEVRIAMNSDQISALYKLPDLCGGLEIAEVVSTCLGVLSIK